MEPEGEESGTPTAVPVQAEYYRGLKPKETRLPYGVQ